MNPLVLVGLPGYLTINLPEQKPHSPGFPLSLDNISFSLFTVYFPKQSEFAQVTSGWTGLE